ncbi:MAG: hypothetical protein LBH92_01400, partial [Bacteroidales bacterium]|nr:hypothetical protein [Bacteroidales bacterium]
MQDYHKQNEASPSWNPGADYSRDAQGSRSAGQKESSSGLKNDLKLPPGMETPKGGGAVRGIGEKTEINPVNGS